MIRNRLPTLDRFLVSLCRESLCSRWALHSPAPEGIRPKQISLVISTIAYFRQYNPYRTAGFQDPGMFCFSLCGSQVQSREPTIPSVHGPFILSLAHANQFVCSLLPPIPHLSPSLPRSNILMGSHISLCLNTSLKMSSITLDHVFLCKSY